MVLGRLCALSTIAHLSTLLHVSCCSSLDLLATSIVVATEAPLS